MIPNFFMIVGASKSGTTSLSDWLNQHPDIRMSTPFETRFFEYEYHKGLDWYKQTYFGNEFSEFNGDGRIKNLITTYAPERVKNMMGHNTKIIIVVREPSERFIIDWAFWKSMRPGRGIGFIEDAIWKSFREFDLEKFSTEEAVFSNLDPAGGSYTISMLETGCYSYYIPKWKKYFHDVLIVTFDDLVTDSHQGYYQVLKFLGAQMFEPKFTHLKKMPRDMIIPVTMRDWLRGFYAQWNVELYQHTGNLPHNWFLGFNSKHWVST